MEGTDTGKKYAASTWLESYVKPSFPTLEENKKAEVVIVGGGAAGMLSAYLLASAGKKVVLIEKNKIGEGTTAYTTGFLTESLDTNMRDLYNILGREDTHELIQGHRSAIDLYEEIIKRHDIECEFVRCSNYIYADTESEAVGLEEELIYYKKVRSEASFEEFPELGFKNSGALQIKNQAKINILKFLSALTIEARKLGVEIYENTEAREVEEGKVTTSRCIIEAQWILVLTYWPLDKELFFKKGTYISYIFELDIKNNKIPIGTYEDTKDPYHYFRIDYIDEGKTRAIVGGEDHRKQIRMDETRNYNALHKYAQKIFGKDNFEIVRKWNGPILEPFDGMALIGRSHKDEKILYATGFSGNGITYSGVTAILLTDIILGNANPLERILSPMRVPPFHALGIKARDYITIMANGAGKNLIHESKKPEF
jgi:glycine/D-amino acid oxidase-like deaminating enzyme